jgi:hypothetical protein
MSDPFVNLLGPGKALKREEPMANEVQGLMDVGAAKLEDARNTVVSVQGRFDLAYGAAHALSLAALRRLGYRPSNRYIVFQLLPHTLGLPASVWRFLIMCHNKRNLCDYEGVMDISDRMLADLIAAAEAIHVALIAATQDG